MQKSNIENINAYWNSAVSIFRLNNQELEEIPIFTYLGMFFNKHINLHHAASHALRPFNAAIRRVKEFGMIKGLLTGLMRCFG